VRVLLGPQMKKKFSATSIHSQLFKKSCNLYNPKLRPASYIITKFFINLRTAPWISITWSSEWDPMYRHILWTDWIYPKVQSPTMGNVPTKMKVVPTTGKVGQKNKNFDLRYLKSASIFTSCFMTILRYTVEILSAFSCWFEIFWTIRDLLGQSHENDPQISKTFNLCKYLYWTATFAL